MPQVNRRLPIVLVFLVPLIAVGLFMPVSEPAGARYLIKGGLFVLVIIGLVLLQREKGVLISLSKATPDESENSPEIIDEENNKKSVWAGFGKAFQQFNKQYLELIQEAVVSDYAGFYLKQSHGKLILHAGISGDDKNPYSGVTVDSGLVQRTLTEGEAVLEGALKQGTRMDGFENCLIRSFLGVPLKWNDDVLGVLAIGSQAEDGFGENDQDYLSHCADLLAETMSVYHRGLRWETDLRVAQIHRDLEVALRPVNNEKEAMAVFMEQVQNLFPFHRLTLCNRHGDEGVIHQVYGQIDRLEAGTHFSLDQGLNGWVLKRNAPILIQDMAEGDYARPRYFQGEDTKHGFRSFLGIPLGRGESAWGCLSIESKEKDQYGDKGKEVLTQLVFYLEAVLEHIYLTERIRAFESNVGVSS